MDPFHVLVLGLVAGATIFLGLPLARARGLSRGTRVALNGLAVGILAFLFAEVLTHTLSPLEEAVEEAAGGAESWAEVAAVAGVALGGLTVGLMSVVYYERWLQQRRAQRASDGALASRSLSEGGEGRHGGLTARSGDHSGTSHAGDVPSARGSQTRAPAVTMTVERPVAPLPERLSEPRMLALLIAVGIGLHNFSEGLAIGSEAASGELTLALLLVIGFALHNATEGFGITAPLAAAGDRPSWSFLGLLGIVAGGPTVVGTIVGQSVTSELLGTGFLALAAGSILYVVAQLVAVGWRMGRRELLFWGVLAGLTLGVATELVIEAAHATGG